MGLWTLSLWIVGTVPLQHRVARSQSMCTSGMIDRSTIFFSLV